ncbi:hypothetical protein CC80DRAFT_495542 [Byssothecium circinans]|uniref:Uncharacterized protein n=1 Tax=Byssothecium circinans TaxID=147558 RepID=A0A6A5TJ61_9PLEO|nr:hypothetical protein CC80DRAFT_495542 [Byssothecium circinans]
MPVGSNSRKRSATGKTAPAKLAIAPPSLVGTPSVGAGPSASEASPPSPLSPRSPSSTPVHRDPIIQPVSSSSGASPTKVTPSPTSVSDPPTIVCTPSVDVGGAAPPGNEVAFSEEVYGPGEGALCVRCWTIHSTKMGGPFVYMWPAGSSTLIDATEEGNRGWRQQLTAKKFVLSAVAFGGALAAGSLAWDTPLHILLSKPHWGRYPVA